MGVTLLRLCHVVYAISANHQFARPGGCLETHASQELCCLCRLCSRTFCVKRKHSMGSRLLQSSEQGGNGVPAAPRSDAKPPNYSVYWDCCDRREGVREIEDEY